VKENRINLSIAHLQLTVFVWITWDDPKRR